MNTPLEKFQLVERSIHKKYNQELWTPFIRAIKQYELISEGDKIAVCISGGKDSMLMAKLMQMLHRHSDFPFDVEYLVMDPGYNEVNRQKIGLARRFPRLWLSLRFLSSSSLVSSCPGFSSR